MTTLNRADIDALPRRYRANLVNGIVGFKPVLLVGTASKHGDSNLAIFSNVFHVGANPALIGLIIRPSPPGTERHTLDNILNTEHYTLNLVQITDAAKAHQTSARYPRSMSEFAAAGFCEHWVDGISAPFVQGSPVHIGLKLAEHQILAINGVHLVIGAVEYLAYPDELAREDGSVNLVDIGVAVATGLDSYHAVDHGIRFHYAKPDQPPGEIN